MISEERKRIHGINKDVVIKKYHFEVDGKREGVYVNHYDGETEKSIGKKIKKRHGKKADYNFVIVEERGEIENIPFKEAKKLNKQFIQDTY